MDKARFDDLTRDLARSLQQGTTRRRLSRLLTALPLGALLPLTPAARAAQQDGTRTKQRRLQRRLQRHLGEHLDRGDRDEDAANEGFCDLVNDSSVYCLSTSSLTSCAVLGRTNMDFCDWCQWCGGSPTDFCERNVARCRPRENCVGRVWHDYCRRCLDPTGRAC